MEQNSIDLLSTPPSSAREEYANTLFSQICNLPLHEQNEVMLLLLTRLRTTRKEECVDLAARIRDFSERIDTIINMDSALDQNIQALRVSPTTETLEPNSIYAHEYNRLL
jgi:hypothetical protein